MMKLLKKVTSIVILCVLCIMLGIYSVEAVENVTINETETNEDVIQEELEALCLLNSEFNVFLNYTHTDEYELYNNDNQNQYTLYMLYNDEEYVGYLIWDIVDCEIFEISQTKPSYFKYAEDNNLNLEDMRLYYDRGIYSIKCNEYLIYMDEFGNSYYAEYIDENAVISRTVISGVTHQIQGSDNCIVAALANVMYYWAGHGYPALNYTGSFSMMKSEIDTLFNGSYRNDSVKRVASVFVESKCLDYSADANANWNPSVSIVVSEIDAGRPCMVGFAAGEGSYSETVGHMTMCYGYTRMESSKYLLSLADGHSSTVVYKQWSYEINDCVITIQLSK